MLQKIADIKIKEMGQTKTIKREEAKERQLIYEELTTKQKIDRLPIGGKSLKELHKLKHGKPTVSPSPKKTKLSRKERWEKRQQT
tara:strand:+ start:131 stop:385 length:255 start_codon:yes stop_codon:yes gene_type:complete